MEFVRKTMTREEMFKKFPGKYLLLTKEEKGFGDLCIGADTKKAYVLAVFDSSSEAYSFDNEEVPDEGSSIVCSEDYTEEVFNLGFVYALGQFSSK